MDIASLSAISGIENISKYDGKTERILMLTSLEQIMGKKLKYAMGQSDSLHDLMVAQQKANVSLQYTVAVKNTAVEAYRSIMNMQI